MALRPARRVDCFVRPTPGCKQSACAPVTVAKSRWRLRATRNYLDFNEFLCRINILEFVLTEFS